MSIEKLPPGVRPWGRKYKACIPTFRNQYVGVFDTIEDAVEGQANYRKEHGLPEPKIGRPKKEQKP